MEMRGCGEIQQDGEREAGIGLVGHGFQQEVQVEVGIREEGDR